MKLIEDIVVVGTDTGVGKTVVSLLLMQLLFAKGYAPFYLKPFQTGCRNPLDVDSDARFVYEHTLSLQRSDPAQSVIYCHQNPKAPYFAARDAGQTIDMNRVRQALEQKRCQYSPLIVEAAGGLMVPVGEDLLFVDVINQIQCRPLLVARAGLGTINHTLLSIEALQNRKIAPMGIVFVDGAPAHADPGLVAENIAAVEMFTDGGVSGVIFRLAHFDCPPQTAFAPLEKILFRS